MTIRELRRCLDCGHHWPPSDLDDYGRCPYCSGQALAEWWKKTERLATAKGDQPDAMPQPETYTEEICPAEAPEESADRTGQLDLF